MNNIPIYLQQHEFEQASLLIEALPLDEQPYWKAILLYYRDGYDLAVSYCQQTLREDSQNIELWGAFGWIEFEEGALHRAHTIFQRALSLGWFKATFLNSISLATQLQDFDYVDSLFTTHATAITATDFQPSEWDVILLCQAQLARHQQQTRDALQLIDAINFLSPEVFLLRGHIFRDQCLYTQSMLAYQMGLDEYPNHPYLQEAFQSVLPLIPTIPSGVHALLKSESNSPHAMAKVRGYLERVQADLLAREASSPEVQHLTDALYGRNRPQPPVGYVEELFDDYAERFESHLLEKLHYQVPRLITSVIENRFSSTQKASSIWDLGCGTGLLGVAIADYTKTLIGVDLSQKMLDRAKDKGCYQQLIKADLLSFLHSQECSRYSSPDVVVIADTLVYIGDLEPFFTALHPHLSASSDVIFTIEQCDGDTPEGFQLMPTGRYTHDIGHLKRMFDEIGLSLYKSGEVDLRQGGGVWVKGWLCMASKSS